MRRESHVRICERLGVKFPRSTRQYLKNFYNSPMGEMLRRYFPGMSYYERFVMRQKRVSCP